MTQHYILYRDTRAERNKEGEERHLLASEDEENALSRRIE